MRRNRAGSRAAFQGGAATRAVESRQLHLLCALAALALARRGGTRVPAQGAGVEPGRLTARELLKQAEGQASQPARRRRRSLISLSVSSVIAKSVTQNRLRPPAALALGPGYAEAWNNIGAAYNNSGDTRKRSLPAKRRCVYKPDFELARNNLRYAREMAKSLAK